jgi:hypothetical protein
VCSADLEKNDRPAARQLRASLLTYAASDRFQPQVEVTKESLAKMLERAKPSKLVRLGARVVETDSEDTAHGNVAAHAIDGDPDTFWHTRWTPRNDPMPHHLVIDLGRETSSVEKKELLKKALRMAVSTENFEEAARLRDEIARIEKEGD